MVDLQEQYRRAAEAIRSADALLIGAGAGMGVDSGLPDFRGPEGVLEGISPFPGPNVQRNVHAPLVSN